MGYKPIENYGVIGDLDTVALVGLDGSIDFMCFPYFDSPSIFASILDEKKGGLFKLTPIEPSNNKQMYLPDTNILLTRFLCSCGISEVSDFMVIDTEKHAHKLIRRAKSVRKDSRFKLEFRPRFDYARSKHKIKKIKDGILFIPENQKLPPIQLRASIPLSIVDGDIEAEFSIKENQTVYFILELADKSIESTPLNHGELVQDFKNTFNFWQTWIASSTYQGRWQEMVHRSALTLKLLTSRKHGSIVAAPTFGLPETLGGVRNWDYRFTWIRDASFTLYALMRLGFTKEAEHFMSWLEDRCRDIAPDGTIQTMYAINGNKILTEETLNHLEGYQQSKPVRIGNAAYDQLQLDIYGELMDAVYLFDKFGKGISFDLWKNICNLVNWVAKNWHLPDEGIWEARSERREYLYSRMMCWVAIDRGIRLSQKRSLPAPIGKWQKIRDEIHNNILANFWNAKNKTFVQSKNSNVVDASILLMPMIKYVSPVDPRWLSTMDMIKDNLVEDSLVFRYLNIGNSHDGLEGIEGTFNMCSFWYVESLTRAGNLKKARFFFEKMLSYANHLGLYSEELSSNGLHLGNFPQAFTHIALISAAFELNRSLER